MNAPGPGPAQPNDAQLQKASAGVAIAALQATRVQIESAERHLRRIIELGDQLAADLAGFDAAATDSDEATVPDGQTVLDGLRVEETLATAQQARSALAELSAWKERGNG